LSEDSAPSASTQWAARYLAVIGFATACLAVVMGYLAFAPIGFAGAAMLSGIALALLAEWRSHLPMNALRVSVDLALCTPLLALIFQSAR
jgi:apolipoprotein N-acyltransferase